MDFLKILILISVNFVIDLSHVLYITVNTQNWGNEFKKLIKKLAGSKSRKIKKLAAWKKFEFLIKKTVCKVSITYYVT